MKMKNTDNTEEIVKITTILMKLDRTKLLVVNCMASTLEAAQRIEDEESKEKV
jgi:hypothetical protein